MKIRFTVTRLAMLFSAGALVAIGCGDAGNGGVPTSHSGQDAYSSNASSNGNSVIPGTNSPVDGYGAVGPGNDLSPNAGPSGPSQTNPIGDPTPIGEGAGGSQQGGGGSNPQGGGGKNQGGNNAQGGGGKNQGIDCNTICACPQFAQVQEQCQASCQNPSKQCLECVTNANGDCAKIASCSVCQGSNPQGGGGSGQGGQGQAGQGQAGQGEAGQGQAGSQGGNSCVELSSCCETLDPSVQSQCFAEVSKGEATCAADLKAIQSMGACLN